MELAKVQWKNNLCIMQAIIPATQNQSNQPKQQALQARDEISSTNGDDQSCPDQPLNDRPCNKPTTSQFTPETPTSEVLDDAPLPSATPLPSDRPHYESTSTSSKVAVHRLGHTKGHLDGYYKKLNEGTMEGKKTQLNIAAKGIMEDTQPHERLTATKAQTKPNMASRLPISKAQVKISPDYIKPAMNKQEWTTPIGCRLWGGVG